MSSETHSIRTALVAGVVHTFKILWLLMSRSYCCQSILFPYSKGETLAATIQQASRSEDPLRDAEGVAFGRHMLRTSTSSRVGIAKVGCGIGLPISGIAVHGRPVGHDGQVTGIKRLEFLGGIDRLAAQDGRGIPAI